ncbi:head completion/stabilization protein [Rappaport israeli]|uniref:head completion/stabilization protein n=1 Tax=Rappaport israeli TaxID=1839807 RepID=UPI0009312C26|nr:head completion/stabilization protein [Rappaport israeli]
MSAWVPKNKPNEHPVPDIVVNPDAFFPDFSLSEFRREMRNDDTITNERLTEHFEVAIIMINALIADWRAQQLGIHRLPVGTQTTLYKTAVYRRVKTYILEQYCDIDTTGDGNERAEAYERRIAHEQQREREAVRLLTERKRTTAVLI